MCLAHSLLIEGALQEQLLGASRHTTVRIFKFCNNVDKNVVPCMCCFDQRSQVTSNVNFFET